MLVNLVMRGQVDRVSKGQKSSTKINTTATLQTNSKGEMIALGALRLKLPTGSRSKCHLSVSDFIECDPKADTHSPKLCLNNAVVEHSNLNIKDVQISADRIQPAWLLSAKGRLSLGENRTEKMRAVISALVDDKSEKWHADLQVQLLTVADAQLHVEHAECIAASNCSSDPVKSVRGWQLGSDGSSLSRCASIELRSSVKSKTRSQLQVNGLTLNAQETSNKRNRKSRYDLGLLAPGVHPCVMQLDDDSGNAARVYVDVRSAGQQYITFPVARRMVRGVDVSDGHITRGDRDFSFKSPGFQLEFNRTYSNLRVNRDSELLRPIIEPMGAGWHHSYLSWLEIKGRWGVVVGTDGSGRIYSLDSQNSTNGYRDRLLSVNGVWQLHTAGGVVYSYAQQHNKRLYLTQISDNQKKPNVVMLNYAAKHPGLVSEVIDTSGRKLVFNYKEMEFDEIGVKCTMLQKVVVNFLKQGPAASRQAVEVAYSYNPFGNLVSVDRGEKYYTYQYTEKEVHSQHRLRRVEFGDDVIEYKYGKKSTTDPRGMERVVQIGVQDVGKFDINYEKFSKASAGAFSEAEPVVTAVVNKSSGLVTRYQLSTDSGRRGLVEKIHSPGNSNPAVLEWSIDKKRLLKSESEPAGRKTVYTHQGPGNVYSETLSLTSIRSRKSQRGFPKKIVHKYKYSKFNKVESVLREMGSGKQDLAQYQYDDKSGDLLVKTRRPRMTRNEVVRSSGISTKYTYDASGNRKSKITENGSQVNYEAYNEYGQPTLVRTKISQGKYSDTKQIFNARGQLHSREKLINGRVNSKRTIEYHLDWDKPALIRDEVTGRPTRLTSIYYDGTGLPTYKLVYQLGADGKKQLLLSTLLSHDADGRVVYSEEKCTIRKTMEVRIQKTSYTDFGAVKQLTEIDKELVNEKAKETRNLTRKYEYNPQGLLKSIERYENAVWHVETTRTYFANTSLVKKETDQYGHSKTYEYDPLGNVSQITYSGISNGIEKYAYDVDGNVIEYTDMNGVVTTTQYDEAGNPAVVTGPGPVEQQFDYDRAGKIIEERNYLINKQSRRIQVRSSQTTYDGLGRKTSLTLTFLRKRNSLVKKTVHDFQDSNGFVETTNAAGEKSRNYQDGMGKTLALVVDPAGLALTTRHKYNANGDLIETIDANGWATKYAVDGWGLVRTTTNSLGKVEYAYYNGNDQIILTWDANGNGRYLIRDGLGRVVKEKIRDRSNGDKWVTIKTIEYNDTQSTEKIYDNTIKDAWEIRVFDALRRVTQIRRSTFKKGAIRNEYLGHHLVQRTDALGYNTRISYDVLRRPKNEQTEIRHSPTLVVSNKTWSYDDVNGQTIETDWGGAKRVTTVDIAGREQTLTVNGKPVFEKTYDLMDRVKTLSSAGRPAEKMQYDAAGRLIMHTLPGNPVRNQRNEYDKNGNIVRKWLSYKPAANPDFRLAYDKLNRVISSTDASKLKTTYEYKGLHMSRVVDAAGESEVYIRNYLGQVLRLTRGRDSSKTLIHFLRDQAGRITKVFYPGKKDVYRRYHYDGGGRLAFRQLISNDGKLKETTRYLYDNNDRLVRTTHPDGSAIDHKSDAIGRNIMQKVTKRGEGTHNPVNQTIEQQFFDDSRTDVVTAHGESWNGVGGGTRTTTKWHDHNGALRAEKTGAGRISRFEHASDGLRQKYAVDDAMSVNYEHDARGRLKVANYHLKKKVLYEYDQRDRLKTIKYPDGSQTVYGRMLNGWINRVTHSDASGSVMEDFTYKIDNVGNAKSVKHTRHGNSRTTNFQHDHQHRLIMEDRDGQKQTYQYDHAGRRKKSTKDGKTSNYTYNKLGRLSTVKEGQSVVLKYSYRAGGQVASRTDEATRTSFWYNPLQQLSICQWEDRSASQALNPKRKGGLVYVYDGMQRLAAIHGKTQEDFVHDGRERRATFEAEERVCKMMTSDGHPVVRFEASSGQAEFWNAMSDRLGSITFMRNKSDESYSAYSAFGELHNRKAVNDDAPVFGNGYIEKIEGIDSDQQLLRMGNRLYDPRIGRFLSEDPLSDISVDQLAIDPYVFARNQPTQYNDPDGRIALRPDQAPTSERELFRNAMGEDLALYGNPSPEKSLSEKFQLPEPMPISNETIWERRRRLEQEAEREMEEWYLEEEEKYDLTGDVSSKNSANAAPASPLDTAESLVTKRSDKSWGSAPQKMVKEQVVEAGLYNTWYSSSLNFINDIRGVGSSMVALWDSLHRLGYMWDIKKNSARAVAGIALTTSDTNALYIARSTSYQRKVIREATQQRLTRGARKLSKAIDLKRSVAEITAYYSKDGRTTRQLATKIAEGAGRSNPNMTWLAVGGTGLSSFFLANGLYNSYNRVAAAPEDEKSLVMLQEAGTTAGGAVGSWAGNALAMTVGLYFGMTTALPLMALSFLGTVTGGFIGSEAGHQSANYAYDEM